MCNAPLSAVARTDDAGGEDHVCVQAESRGVENQRRRHGFAFCVVALHEFRRIERLLRDRSSLGLLRDRMDGAYIDQLADATLFTLRQNIARPVDIHPVKLHARIRGHRNNPRHVNDAGLPIRV